MSHIGVLGLGKMGLPMALNLSRAGLTVTGYNRSEPARAAAAAEGVTPTDDSASLAACDIVICMLPDLPDLEPHLENILAPGHGVKYLVVMSTVSPLGVAELATRLAAQGVAVVDAPVSGGEAGAIAGTLSIMVGAAPEAFAAVARVLNILGTTVAHLGAPGAGSTAKACNQLIVAATVAANAEAALLARAAGLDVGQVFDVLSGGLARSEVMLQKRDKFAAEDFSTSGAAKFLVKDLGFGVALARQHHINTPMLNLTEAAYIGLTEAGLGELDNTVIYRYLRETPQQHQGE